MPEPAALTPPHLTRLGTTPLSFDVALDPLSPGPYTCQVNVLDPTGGAATCWQAPIMIVQ